MKKILLIIFTIILILSVNVLAVDIDIDIGCPAIDRAGSLTGLRTAINKGNPADADIIDVDINYISSFADNANQGICSDGTYIYTINSSTLYKYSKAGVLQNSRNISGDHPSYDQMGDLCYYNGFLYVGVGNYPSTPSRGAVLKINASTLALNNTISTQGNHEAGGITRHPDGTFWVISYTDLSPSKIYKYSADWVYQAVYDLETVAGGSWGYDGIEWINGYLFANTHDAHDGNYCDVYYFSDGIFKRIIRFSHMINGKVCGQGIGLDPTEDNILWWAARGDSDKAYKTEINFSGTILPIIIEVEIWAYTDMTLAEVATFYRPNPGPYPDKFTTRDYEAIGTVTAGSKQTFTVNLDVQVGDYIGIKWQTGAIERDVSGGDGLWHTDSDQIPCANYEFSLNASWIVSLYGYSAAVGWDHKWNTQTISKWNTKEIIKWNGLE